MKNTIRIERAKKEITQQTLAEQVGVTRQSINAIEKRKFIPSALTAIKIAKYFELRVEEVFIIEESDWQK